MSAASKAEKAVYDALHAIAAAPSMGLIAETDLREDAGLDHTDLSIVAEHLEATLGISIPNSRVEEWQTVQDLVDCVLSRLAARDRLVKAGARP